MSAALLGVLGVLGWVVYVTPLGAGAFWVFVTVLYLAWRR